MAQYDPKTGRLRPTWTVRFSPWAVFVGCLVGGTVTGLLIGISFFLVPVEPPLATDELLRSAIFALGASIGVFLLLGPTLAWGLGFALRENTNHGVHVLAFAGLGLVVGYMVGEILGSLAGFSGFGAGVAPFVGIGAALGRWSISRYAKI